VDASRLVSAGTSRGGVLAVAHAGLRPGLFEGVLNFVGGWLGEGCVDATAVNRSAFARGAASGDASLWLYGENDSFYSLAHSRGSFDAFVAAGGQGTFLTYARAPGLNGHFLVNDPALWTGDLDAYLGGLAPE
jgi:dienelactone hydrolase